MFKKPTVFSDESGSHVLGKDGGIKASFSVADHGASHEGAAVSHLQQNFDDYMAEANYSHRAYASHSLMHPDMAKDMNKNDDVDYYLPGTGDKHYGTVTKNDGASVHIRAYNKIGKNANGPLHKFKVTPHLPTNEEAEQIDELDWKVGGVLNRYGAKVAGDPNRQKGRDLAKRKQYVPAPGTTTPKVRAIAREEVEQVDEISSDMAYRYLQGKRERDYDISPDGKSSKLKKPQSFGKMNKDMKSTSRALRTIEKAKKTNEEVEQIDELSKETLGRYIKKAATKIGTQGVTAGLKIAKDERSQKNFDTIGKRERGITTAVSKLTKEAKDSHEYDYEGEMVHNQLQQMLHHIAELKGMVKPNTNLPEWVQSKITLACDYIQTASDYLSGEMKEENGMPFKGPYRKVGERKDEYGNTVKNVAKHLAKKAMDKQTNEEAELEEKRGLWDNIHAKRERIKKGSGEKMRKPGSEGAPTAAALKASQTEAVDNPYAVGMAAAMKSTGDTPPLEKSTITKAHKIAKKVMKENKFLTGVLNKLEEGRGRPAKEGSAAWHRQQAATAAGKPKEEPVALGMQLRKAKSINAHVEFDDGKKHEIHPKHIVAFNDHMDSHRTTQEKAAFQKKASASHDAFVKAVTAPLPTKKDSGDYGMPKYR